MSVTVEQTPLPVGLPFTDREEVGDTQTDLRHWRLRVDNGRHMWKYVEGHDRPQRFNEKYWLGLPLEAPDSTASPMNRPAQSLKNGLGFLKQLQTEQAEPELAPSWQSKRPAQSGQGGESFGAYSVLFWQA